MHKNRDNTVVAIACGGRGIDRTTADQLIGTRAEVAIAAPGYDVASGFRACTGYETLVKAPTTVGAGA